MGRVCKCGCGADCNDGSDETAAACARTTCRAQQFQCAASRRCVPAWWRCDGAPDCGRDDLSDELDCAGAPCSKLTFACDNGACLPWELYCDGHADCADASDERACRDASSARPSLPTPPPRRYHELVYTFIFTISRCGFRCKIHTLKRHIKRYVPTARSTFDTSYVRAGSVLQVRNSKGLQYSIV